MSNDFDESVFRGIGLLKRCDVIDTQSAPPILASSSTRRSRTLPEQRPRRLLKLAVFRRADARSCEIDQRSHSADLWRYLIRRGH